ncbi:DUF4282 domain-containing protein [Caulobacter mirabilis]|uniref:DUF4282 domain-containing protein n=1 Tax=Caulobacter mirabilis TaxID=69666 RepID=A0A2D2AV02_9CAUL|nr:DUF4282 domain-containing protein [Caulobacter mirabilis]ATQ41852.1 hypothetical protein CSW64_05205 [Caulobacter mirabilis]
MAPKSRKRGSGGGILWDLLTFDRLISGPLIHLIYWSGLGVIVLGAFGAIGAAVGVVLSDDDIVGKLLALPVSIAGVLVCVALVLLWRSFCEFYVAIFRISEDLRAMRQAGETDLSRAAPTAPPPQRFNV